MEKTGIGKIGPFALIAAFAAGCSLFGTRTVRVSDFGYDPEDSTKFVQAALDSGAGRVVFDRQRGPWVTTTVFGRSDQEIVFEDGVELQAKPGAFASVHDDNSCLFVLRDVTNVTIRGEGKAGGTLRMRKADYQDKSRYAHSEWRHGLVLAGAVNVSVEKMNFVATGGDGIYIRDGSANVAIRSCVCDDNHRQGISVISVDGLLIEDCVLSNTKGTPPEAGIDFEPNVPEDRLANCTMRRCRAFGNAGSGYELYAAQMTSKTKDLSILIEDCTSEDNRRETSLQCGSEREADFVQGEIRLRNCTFGKSRGCDGPRHQVKDSSRGFAVVYENCTGADDIRRTHPMADAILAQTGGDTIVRPVLPKAGEVEILDRAPGEMVALAGFESPAEGRFVFFAEKDATARFRMRQSTVVKGRPACTKPIEITASDDPSKVWKLDQPGFEGGEISFTAPRRGFYRLKAPVESVRFRLEAANVPVALDLTGRRAKIVGCDGKPFSLHFPNEGTGDSLLAFSGDWYYKFAVRVVGPDGRSFWNRDLVEETLATKVPRGGRGLWRIDFEKAAKPNYDWIMLDFLGTSDCLFLSPEKTWRRVRTVRVSDFGYDREDSTRFLQAAFDSGADRVIVDRQAGPWIATPLFGRSDQEIVFEDGVELVAKRGEFKGVRDMLLSFILTTNVVLRGEGKRGGTLRMWKTDYQDKTQYKPAEWRYTLALYGVLNARVENMSFVASGGDGICIANRRVDGKACPSRNVIVRNCVSDDNHRQALTVGGARNILIEDCVFRNTKGTPPEAGVDFEPDNADEELVDCVMRRCRFENNNGSGIEFYGQQLNATSKPLSMLFEDCTTSGNRQEVAVQCGSSRTNPVKGEVRFRNCTFGNSRGMDKAKIILMDSSRGYRTVFEKCTGAREGLIQRSHPLMDGVVALTGGREPPRVSLPPVERTKVADARPGEMVELAPCDSVGDSHYVFFAEKGRTAKFRMRQVTAIRGRQASVKPVRISPFSATGVLGKAQEFPQPGFEGGEISFEAPARGFYSLRADTEGVRFRLEAANVPVALDTMKGARRLVGRDGRPFSLFVRNAGPAAAILGFSGDWYYRFQAAVFDPSGRETWRRALVETPVALTVPGGKEGLWRVEFSKPEKPVYDWVTLDAFDAPIFYFLSSEKTWRN